MILRADEPGRRKDQIPSAALTPWRAMEPHSEDGTLPRESQLSSRPQSSEH